MITGQGSQSIRTTRCTHLPRQRPDLSSSSSMDKVTNGGLQPFPSTKQSRSHVVLPTLSLRRKVLTNGKQLNAPDVSPIHHVPNHQPPTTMVTATIQAEFCSSNNFKGCAMSRPMMELFGQPAGFNLTVTSSPMTVTGQAYSAGQHSGNVPYADARPVLSRESLASTTLSLSETQSMFSGRHEWPYGYRVLPPVGFHQANEGGEQLSFPPGTAMSGTTISGGTSTSASLPSYLFAGDAGSPRQRRSKKRALSMSPLSDLMGIDFNSIIRTSPTSLVAYINGSRSSPSSHPTLSPVQSEGYGHFLGVRGRCIPQASPLSVPESSWAMATQTKCGHVQLLEKGGGLASQMANMVVEQQCFPEEGGALEKTLESQNQSSSNLLPSLQLQSGPTAAQQAAILQGPPPPYHSHKHIYLHRHHSQIKTTSFNQVSSGPYRHGMSFLPQVPMLEEEEGELEELGVFCCMWLDCSAVYDQKEELVRHIEKLHVDHRKAEDFTCYWAGCPRNFKPFNARYKLLIHMRVHSGEKPNKCTVQCDHSSLYFCATEANPVSPVPTYAIFDHDTTMTAKSWRVSAIVFVSLQHS